MNMYMYNLPFNNAGRYIFSVVIANANGIFINGLGFINADNALLTTGKITGWADGNI